jgi:predicted nuclease of predicted toxin-antitoxin system
VIIWLDNHLSPALARWIASDFKHECRAIRDLGLSRAPDKQLFEEARKTGAALLTKDRDFAELVDRLGPPPAIILLTCGNTSTKYLQEILGEQLRAAIALIEGGEALVEVGGAP